LQAYGIQAVKGIDFECPRRRIGDAIGSNGAGKTTTMKATMVARRLAGDIEYPGKEHQRAAPGDLVKEGLAMVPEAACSPA
jgi:ABC-type branched-subunit amino acid transport system ATPase component